MPQLSGTDFLLAAKEHFPDARRVLLKKLEMRQRTQAESEEPMPPKVLHGLIVQFLLGCSILLLFLTSSKTSKV